MDAPKIKNITGQWLDSYKWTYFVTLTTRKELTLKSARRLAEVFYNKVNERSVFLGQKNTAFTYFIEAFENKKGYHIHALLFASVTKKDVFNIWQIASGVKNAESNYVRALDFVNEFGATFYVAKYITKSAFDWDFDYRGALALQNQNDLFDYKVNSSFQGWRKFEPKLKQESIKQSQKSKGSSRLDSPQRESSRLELLQERKQVLQEQKKRISKTLKKQQET